MSEVTEKNPICSIANSVPELVFLFFKDVTGIEVQLVGGKSSSEGRVEILFNGEWGTVCDDKIHQADVDVMCGMMGYS